MIKENNQDMPALFRIRQNSERRLLWGLSLASIIVYINLYLMQGMLPAISDHFLVDVTQATLVLPVTSFTLALALLGFAIVSDRFGRRRPILASLWLLVASDFALVFVSDFYALLAMRLLQGVLLAAVPAIAMAYFRDQLSADFMLKAAAVYIAANSLGGISGRLLGGLVSEHFSWPQSMLLLSALTTMGVACVWFLLQKNRNPSLKFAKSSQTAHPGFVLADDLKGFLHHLQSKQMRMVYLIGGIAFMMMVNQFSFIQLHFIEQFHWSRFDATLIFLCYLSGTFASYRSARWIARYGQSTLYRKAVMLMLCGTLLTLNDTVSFIFAGFLLTACGFFLMHACCNSWVAVHATQHRAKATSLYLCSYYLGASFGGPYLMFFWNKDLWAGVVTGSMLLLAILSLVLAKLHNFTEDAAHDGLQTQAACLNSVEA